MYRTVNVNLQYDDALVKTIEVATEIYQKALDIAHSQDIKSKYELNKVCYHPFREQYPDMPSVLVQQCIFRASETIKVCCRSKRRPIAKRKSARFTSQSFKFYPDASVFGVPTIEDHKKIPMTVPDWIKDRGYDIKDIQMATVTLNRYGNPVAHITFQMPSPEKSPNKDYLGIDRGIVNIAVCSDNTFFNSKHLKNVKGKYQFLKGELQHKGTKSAKRHLRKLANKERRFVSDVNHNISKTIVNMPYDTFVLEDLSKIKKRAGRPKSRQFRRKLGNWSYYQLQQFIEYKAEALGKSVIYVEPAYTSQECSKCGFTDKSNRHGSVFHCKKCGYELNADLNASRNIASRGKLFGAGSLQPTVCSDGQPSGTIPQPRAVGS